MNLVWPARNGLAECWPVPVICDDKGTTKHHQVRRIRFVTPDVAIVDIDNEIRGVRKMPAGIAVPPDGVLKTQLMEIFVRRGDRWVIEAYHNVDTKPVS